MFLPHTLCKSLYDQLPFATAFCFPVQDLKYSSDLDLCWTHQT